MREFTEGDEYKINTQKLIVFVYANTSTLENTKKKTFTIETKRDKTYLGIN